MNGLNLLEVLIFAATLGCALMAGLFFAFSVAVMKALGALAPACGIAAMQSINRVIVNRVFLGVFFGTAALCLAVIVTALSDWSDAGAVFALAGALLYLVGVLLVTMAFNVPRNNLLASVDPASGAGARLWADYLFVWTAWNHLRTFAALAACACLVLAL
jgi:uncharacterized membrane protein